MTRRLPHAVRQASGVAAVLAQSLAIQRQVKKTRALPDHSREVGYEQHPEVFRFVARHLEREADLVVVAPPLSNRARRHLHPLATARLVPSRSDAAVAPPPADSSSSLSRFLLSRRPRGSLVVDTALKPDSVRMNAD